MIIDHFNLSLAKCYSVEDSLHSIIFNNLVDETIKFRSDLSRYRRVPLSSSLHCPGIELQRN